MHATDNGYHRQPPVSGDAAPVHLQGSRVYSGLLGGQPAVARRAASDLDGDQHRSRRRRRQHSRHAGRQQVRRDGVAARGDDGRGRGARQAVEVRLHGNVGQDRPQRQRAVSGAAAAGETPKHFTAAGRQQVAVAATPRDVTGEVCSDVTGHDGV